MGNRTSRRLDRIENDLRDLKSQVEKLNRKLGNTESSKKTGQRNNSRSKRDSFNVERYQKQIQKTLERAGEE